MHLTMACHMHACEVFNTIVKLISLYYDIVYNNKNVFRRFPLKFVCSAGLALTPPLGWRSWNGYHGRVTDADIRATIDVITSRSRTVGDKLGGALLQYS